MSPRSGATPASDGSRPAPTEHGQRKPPRGTVSAATRTAPPFLAHGPGRRRDVLDTVVRGALHEQGAGQTHRVTLAGPSPADKRWGVVRDPLRCGRVRGGRVLGRLTPDRVPEPHPRRGRRRSPPCPVRGARAASVRPKLHWGRRRALARAPRERRRPAVDTCFRTRTGAGGCRWCSVPGPGRGRATAGVGGERRSLRPVPPRPSPGRRPSGCRRGGRWGRGRPAVQEEGPGRRRRRGHGRVLGARGRARPAVGKRVGSARRVVVASAFSPPVTP